MCVYDNDDNMCERVVVDQCDNCMYNLMTKVN